MRQLDSPLAAGRPNRQRHVVPVAPIACGALLLVCGCSDGGTATGTLAAAAEPRIESQSTSGDADRLAAELMLVTGTVQASPLRPAFALPAAGLREAVANIAFDHLRTIVTTDGVGPDLAGSQLVRRLALEPGAPADLNQNGTNLDETAAAESARIAAFAGVAMPAGVVQPFLPWAETSAQLRAPLAAGQEPDPASWRLQHPGRAVVRLEHLAASMRLRALAAARLLEQGHGAFVGRTGEEGLLGLLLAQQLLAAEETLLQSLATDSTTGGPLGPVPDPAEYDPDAGLHWFPAAFAVLEDAARPGIPTGYRTADVASDLLGLSLLLEAAAETVWAASAVNPSPTLRAVFQGEPFPPPDPGPPPPPVLNWQQNIQPLIIVRCAGCHFAQPVEGGFSVVSLASVMAGGVHAQSYTMIVPGDHASSFLHRILTGPQQLPGRLIPRMPFQSPSLPAPERQLIADWIDAGALEFPPAAPVPPVVGQDLLRVCFVNLVAMHFDPVTGALHHRHEGDGPSGIATATATGAALRALQAAAAVMPDLEFRGLRPAAVLQAATKFATRFVSPDSGRVAADIELASGQRGAPADLAGQAATAAGLLAAIERVPDASVKAAARRATEHLLTAFADPVSGAFRSVPEHAFARYTPSVLADLLAALRSAPALQLEVLPADALLERLLATVRAVLAHSEWGTGGELFGDGIDDTNQNGIKEPGAAGGPFGRLPLLAGAILVGDTADAGVPAAAVTWSQHVRPLLFEQCGSCHFAGSLQSTYRLDTRRLAEVPASPGVPYAPIVPFDAEASLLYRKLADRIPPVGVQMPQGGTPMSAVQREIVRLWIEAGASSR
ncbi:MAG TPA: hypothetical protein VF384_20045 [Planctomycetota bacterium]